MTDNMSNAYTNEEREALLTLVRTTITNHLSGGEPVSPAGISPLLDNKKFQEKRGVFVTLHKAGHLRGCIGYPLPIKPLLEAVMDNALSAAMEDSRFPSVEASELEAIEIEISVLTVPKTVAGPEEVEVGRDGIIISKGFNRGLLLPQVPVEQGWDRREYISYGCQKAGLPADEWQRGVKIETFQGEVFHEAP